MGDRSRRRERNVSAERPAYSPFARAIRDVLFRVTGKASLAGFAECGMGTTVSRRATVAGRHEIRLGADTHVADFAILHCGPCSATGLAETQDPREHITLADHCNIQPYAFLSSCGGWIELGDNCSVNPFCILYGYGGLRIGNNVRIANGCAVVPQNHVITPGTGSLLDTGVTGKGITIQDNVWLASHVIVLDGVTIGEGAVIGAGAVVTRDIPAGVVAVGVPAVPVRDR
jgi:acetyltransferase-like isoleucine patch superfamily enzyme